jgi:hypothetical protein
MKAEGATVIDDLLQKEADPVAILKAQGDKLAVVVPFEWLWDAQLAPMKNPQHKQFYDADSLSEHLEKAGYKQFVLRVLQVDNFSFLTAEAIRTLTSKERRKQRRTSLQKVAV